jgi:two-component system response regulator QseB
LRILVVEDDSRIADPLAAALRSQRHMVDVALSGEHGLELFDAHEHELVVLDLMLPGISGLEVCRTLRRRGSVAKVLIMTARDSVRDKVTALDEGADDYVVKPFDSGELLARVRALSRRGDGDRGVVLGHGLLELDQNAGEARYEGRRIELTRTEYAMLETMLRHPTRVFSADMLYSRVASFDGAGDSGTIKSHVANLRKKFRTAGSRSSMIVTVYGFGYRLADA